MSRQCSAATLTCIIMKVVSGDLITEIPPGAVAATHRRHDAVVTAMLCPVPVSGLSDSASSGAKEKSKKTSRYNIVSLDPTKQFLLHIAAGECLHVWFSCNISFLFWYVTGRLCYLSQELKLTKMYELKRAFFEQLAWYVILYPLVQLHRLH